MACGCPLVVSDIPAHREILDDRTAWFTSLDDPIGAAQAIHAALTEVADTRKRAAAAQANAAERPNLRTTALLYERAYKNAIETHKRSSREQRLWIESAQNEWQLPLNREET
jgi:glycosyltransferase involved in cell wall biosynthesis